MRPTFSRLLRLLHLIVLWSALPPISLRSRSDVPPISADLAPISHRSPPQLRALLRVLTQLAETDRRAADEFANHKNADGTTALMLAVENPYDKQRVAEALLAAEQVDPNATDERNGSTALMAACERGYLEKARIAVCEPSVAFLDVISL